MKLTLICIGVSLILITVNPIYYIITKKTFPILILVLVGHFSTTLEKIGIIIDIARLSIILIALKQLPNQNRNVNIVKQITLLAVSILILLYITLAILYI